MLTHKYTLKNVEQIGTNNFSKRFKVMYEEKAERKFKTKPNNPLITKIGNANPIWVLLFLPYSPRYSKLKLFPLASREKKRHVPLYNEAVVAIPNLSVTVSNASRGALPC